MKQTFRAWLETRAGNNFGHTAIGLALCLIVASVLWLLPVGLDLTQCLWAGWLYQSAYWHGRETAHFEIHTGVDSYGRWWHSMNPLNWRGRDESPDFWAPVVCVLVFVLAVSGTLL